MASSRVFQRALSFPSRQTTTSYLCRRCLASDSSSTPRAPPLLLKLRGDLKSAMKTKDTNRLAVLRGLLADITNASKTSAPIKTDMQVLSMLRKRAAMSKAAGVQFADEGRPDLKEQEDAQVLVLEEYAGGVEVVSEEEVRNAVVALRESMVAAGEKVDKGSMLKKLIGDGGVYHGQNVEKAVVARAVQDVLSGEK